MFVYFFIFKWDKNFLIFFIKKIKHEKKKRANEQIKLFMIVNNL